jgi:hypothetical protein
MKLKLKSTNIRIRKDYKNGEIDKCGGDFFGEFHFFLLWFWEEIIFV